MKFLLFSTLLISSLLSTIVGADERILSFTSNIQVFIDGSMQVTETIKVNAEKNKIKRGIYRDFPTHYKDQLGNNYKVQFDIKSVLRNGEVENYHIQTKANGIRLYLGDKNHRLSMGEYTYSITYRTDRQLGFFNDHDELYWNATGNGWIFPIDKVLVEIQLPDAISSDNLALEAYTGRTGSKGNDYQSTVNSYGNAQFATSRTLLAYEGLTIVVSWPKGIIKEPDFTQKTGYLLKDNLPLLVGLIGLLIIFFYYLWVWNKVGKDPEAGVIFPHYNPPKGFSPASMRYIFRMSYDHKTFATAIVNLAVKGALEISESVKKYSLIRSLNTDVELAAGEAVLMEQLFSESSTISLENTNHRIIANAISAHNSSLKNDYHKIYFMMNSVWLLPGILTSIGAIAAIFLTANSNDGPASLVLFWVLDA